MLGRVVMDVQLDGCMAHIATINRVASWSTWKSHEEVFGSKMDRRLPDRPYEYLICRTVQPGFTDDRDADEFFRVPPVRRLARRDAGRYRLRLEALMGGKKPAPERHRKVETKRISR